MAYVKRILIFEINMIICHSSTKTIIEREFMNT